VGFIDGGDDGIPLGGFDGMLVDRRDGAVDGVLVG
jgi:hypothetical protein